MKENLINNEEVEGGNNNIRDTNKFLNNTLDKENEDQRKSNSSGNSRENTAFSNPRKICYIITLGEIIAILSVGSGEISNKIAEDSYGHSATVLCFIYYITFGIFWTIFNHGLTKPKYYYFLIILFDTQTNFFKILALSKGDLYYYYIINSSSILFCALLTYIFIKKYRYTWKHFLACFLCFIGTVVIFYGVLKGKGDIIDELKKNYLGFIFSLISAIFFALTIVVMEIKFNKGKDIYNYFPFLGILGTLIITIESIIYFRIYDIKIENFQTDLVTILFCLAFMVISIIMGTIIPFYIKRYSASMLNLFMISQIFWSYIFTLIFERKSDVSFFSYIGFAIILFSTILFSMFKLKTNPNPHQNKKEIDTRLNSSISPIERTSLL